MSLVAVPVNVPMVTTVAVVRVVPPLNVAVTVTLVALSSSPNVSGLTLKGYPRRRIVIVRYRRRHGGPGGVQARRRPPSSRGTADSHYERLPTTLVYSILRALHRERL